MLDADTLADHKDKIDFNAEEFFENSFGIYVEIVFRLNCCSIKILFLIFKKEFGIQNKNANLE